MSINGTYKNIDLSGTMVISKSDSMSTAMSGTVSLTLDGKEYSGDLYGNFHYVSNAGPLTYLVCTSLMYKGTDPSTMAFTLSGTTNNNDYNAIDGVGSAIFGDGDGFKTAPLLGKWVRQ